MGTPWRTKGSGMKVDNVYFTSLGVLLPERASAEEAVKQGLYDAEAYAQNQLTAVCVAGDISAPEMAVLAGRHALERTGTDVSQVGMLFHAGVFLQGPEMWLPGYYILRELGGNAIPAFDIRMGCNSVFAALELATTRMAALDPEQSVLITAADNMASPLIDRWNVPGFLVGDAASALLLSQRGGFARLLAIGSMSVTELEPMHRGAEPLFPPGATSGRKIDMLARGMHFVENVMEIQQAGEMTVKGLQELTGRTLAEAGVEKGEIKRLIYGNAAGYFLEHLVLNPLGFTVEQSTWQFGAGIGHTGASDQLLSLDHLVTTGAVEPGDKILLAGGAPGYSLSCAVVEILDIPAWAR